MAFMNKSPIAYLRWDNSQKCNHSPEDAIITLGNAAQLNFVSIRVTVLNYLIPWGWSGGAAKLRGSVRASRPAAAGSNPGSTAKLVESRDRNLNPSSAHAKDFEVAVQRRPELSTTINYLIPEERKSFCN